MDLPIEIGFIEKDAKSGKWMRKGMALSSMLGIMGRCWKRHEMKLPSYSRNVKRYDPYRGYVLVFFIYHNNDIVMPPGLVPAKSRRLR